MALIDKIKAKAKANLKHIVLPEGEETRNVQAAVKIAEQGIAKLTLLGDPAKVREVAAGASLEGLTIIDPKTSDKCEQYAATLYELRKAKGMTPEQAAELVKDPMYYGVMMVKMGDADGLVSGAIHSTGDMLRPIRISIRHQDRVLLLPDGVPQQGLRRRRRDGLCRLRREHRPRRRAACPASLWGAADSARALAGIEPRVAMLSFSTKGSAKHDLVTKVQEATRIAKELSPDLMLTANCSWTPPSSKASASSRRPAAPWPARPTCWCSRVWKRPTSATSWCSAWRVRRPTAPFCRASPSRATTSPAACSVDDIVATVAITAAQA